MSESRTILVTCARYRIALALATSLKKAGHRVILSDSLKWPLGRFSRFQDGYAQYHDPAVSKEQFIQDLLRICSDHQVDHIMPSFQETALIAQYQDRFQNAGISSFLSPGRKIQQANDKGWVTDQARALGIAVPETWCPENMGHVRDLAPSLPYPVILKPRGGKAGAGQVILKDPQDLIDAWHQMSSQQDNLPLIQQLIIGPDLCVAHLYDHGHCLATYGNRIRRQLQRVHSIDKESFTHQPAMDAARTLLDHLEWHGIAELDFILEETTGCAYLLEINPRYWGSLQNAIEAGVDFPSLALKAASGKSFSVPVQQDGLRSIWLYPYLLSTAQALFKGRFRHFLDHLFNPFSTQVRLDEFSFRDPLPALVEPFLGLANLLTTGGLSLDRPKAQKTSSLITRRQKP